MKDESQILLQGEDKVTFVVAWESAQRKNKKLPINVKCKETFLNVFAKSCKRKCQSFSQMHVNFPDLQNSVSTSLFNVRHVFLVISSFL